MMAVTGDKPYRALSWGVGLQSTTLGVMSALGQLDPVSAVITADTGWERQVTYDMRDFYVQWFEDHGVYVEVIQAGDIRVLGATEHVHIPFYTDSGAPLNRQCTRAIKIRPIKRRIRELIGYHRSNPPHPPAKSVELWLGITMDEFTRAKHSDVQFIVNRWPFLELRVHRLWCEDYLKKLGLPVPPKSACVCCPYRRASEWIEMRDQAPEEWKAVIEFDEANRNNPFAQRDVSDAPRGPGAGSTSDELYIWSTREGPGPLAEADLEHEARREKRINVYQESMFACESGYCGI